MTRKTINLALQGGGAHGAFTGGYWTRCWKTTGWNLKASAAPAPVP
ncbi:hypothetical protein [Paludibacterium denitrificans]|nr:hypothetical protein [Paludibacterium denitrificans]